MNIVFTALRDDLKNAAYVAPQSTVHMLEIENPILGDSVPEFEGDTNSDPASSMEDLQDGGYITFP